MQAPGPDELVNDPRPLLPSGRWFKVFAAVVAVAAVVALYSTHHSSDESSPVRPPPTSTSPISEPVDAPIGSSTSALTSGLFIEGKTPERTVVYQDPSDAGVWSVVVRDVAHGSIGHLAAVVTYPLTRSSYPATATPPGKYLDVTVDGRTARVHGNVPAADLAAIARAVRVVDGRPVVRDVPGYETAFTGPYGGCNLLEAWYRTEDLGREKVLGPGYVYTVVTDCASLEDALVTTGSRVGPSVYVRPSAISSVLGGAATLTWGLERGLVGVVGYRGLPASPARIAALTTIAKEVRTHPGADWSRTRPFIQRSDALAPWLDGAQSSER